MLKLDLMIWVYPNIETCRQGVINQINRAITGYYDELLLSDLNLNLAAPLSFKINQSVSYGNKLVIDGPLTLKNPKNQCTVRPHLVEGTLILELTEKGTFYEADYGKKLLLEINRRLEGIVIKNQIENLYRHIQTLYDYGKKLAVTDIEKSKITVELAEKLHEKTKEFFSSSTTKDSQSVEKFQNEFCKLLHSQDENLREHRKQYKPIIANILIALSGIGLIALAGKIVFTSIANKKFAFNECLFFSKTKRQELSETIEKTNEEMTKTLAAFG